MILHEGGGGTPKQLRNTVCFLSVFRCFDLCDRYGRFNSVTDRSNRVVTVTGEPFWTNP